MIFETFLNWFKKPVIEDVALLHGTIIWTDCDDYRETFTFYLFLKNGKRSCRIFGSRDAKKHSLWTRVICPWLSGHQTVLQDYLNSRRLQK